MLPWCLAAVVLGHLALLGLGPGSLREWQRDRLQARPVSTPMAVKVRHLASGPAASPLAPAREAAGAAQNAASAPAAQAEPAMPQEAAPPTVEPAVYVPRALLSVAPVARAPVLLQWPANWPFKQSYTAVLKLYLDEQGRVERVEPDGEPALPGPLLESARQAFMAADFTAGQLNGQAVKSWIRVEVSFESGPPPATP